MINNIHSGEIYGSLGAFALGGVVVAFTMFLFTSSRTIWALRATLVIWIGFTLSDAYV
jgi:hypothetical protein